LESTRSGTDALAQLLRRPEVNYHDLPNRNETLTAEEIQQVEITIKYAGYIDRQQAEVEKFKNLEDKQFPALFDYSLVPSLRTEARQKLAKIRPTTLGQASRISGVSPADISILMVWLKRGSATEREAVSGKKEVGDACPLETGEPE
jgi:tRNA uridine 5-carboxymethylaminomethyl modification enzyme